MPGHIFFIYEIFCFTIQKTNETDVANATPHLISQSENLAEFAYGSLENSLEKLSTPASKNKKSNFHHQNSKKISKKSKMPKINQKNPGKSPKQKSWHESCFI